MPLSDGIGGYTFWLTGRERLTSRTLLCMCAFPTIDFIGAILPPVASFPSLPRASPSGVPVPQVTCAPYGKARHRFVCDLFCSDQFSRQGRNNAAFRPTSQYTFVVVIVGRGADYLSSASISFVSRIQHSRFVHGRRRGLTYSSPANQTVEAMRKCVALERADV